MTESLLLDTHIALWLDSGDESLRAATRTAIDACWKSGGTICFSAVSVWEIALLVHKGHVELDCPLDRSQFRQIAGYRGMLVKTIDISGQALRVGRRRERIRNAQIGDVLRDALQFGPIPRHRNWLQKG